ncbi:MAG: hypothetical protein ACRENP_25850 [Longimicrobiales bacterium]
MTNQPNQPDPSSATPDDPIVAQVRAQRDSLAAALNYDLDALFDRVKKLEETERAKGRVLLRPATDTPGAAA